jgi:hypothetical protein
VIFRRQMWGGARSHSFCDQLVTTTLYSIRCISNVNVRLKDAALKSSGPHVPSCQSAGELRGLHRVEADTDVPSPPQILSSIKDARPLKAILI